jgi:mannose/fructose/N-acetylgalactosamine-specific phosphotransferase system component IIB
MPKLTTRYIKQISNIASKILGQGSDEYQYQLSFAELKPSRLLSNLVKKTLVISGISFLCVGSAIASGFPTVELSHENIQQMVNSLDELEQSQKQYFILVEKLQNQLRVEKAKTNPVNTCIYENTTYSLGAAVKMVNGINICTNDQIIIIDGEQKSSQTLTINSSAQWLPENQTVLRFINDRDYENYLKTGWTQGLRANTQTTMTSTQ